MLALAGWAIAAFWLARWLVWTAPGLISMRPEWHPAIGPALAALAGLALREKGPVVWMAAGLALCDRLGGPRGFQPDWIHAAAAGVFVLGARRAEAGALPLLGGVLLPLAVLRELSARGPWRWQSAALCLAAAALLLLAARGRVRWHAPRWRLWPGFAAAGLLVAGNAGFEQWTRAQRAAALASLPRPDAAAPYPVDFFHRGVSFTAEGVPYDSPRALAMLRELPAYAVDSVALVPYGFSPRGQTAIRIPGAAESWESTDGMALLTAEAHALGLRVMVKPHVWRLQGRTDLPDAREWMRQYRPFALHYATFAARVHADIFCIGTELRGLTGLEAEWRELIAAVRAVYKGPVVYAANHGEEFESIRFWDALDYIGLDNYYPLDDRYSPALLVEKIERVHARFGKPVLFTEAGYGAHQGSHREPWADESPAPLDLDEQARSYRALLSAVYRKPWFRGVYWWKVGTNGYGGHRNNSMTPWRKPAMDVVREFYLLRLP